MLLPMFKVFFSLLRVQLFFSTVNYFRNTKLFYFGYENLASTDLRVQSYLLYTAASP